MLTDSLSTSSICFFKRICFRFRMISVTSSTTPAIVENSCSTPSIFTDVMAYPSRDDKRTLLSALPTVNPYPGSRGLNSNFPLNSVESIMITLPGFWKLNNAILFRLNVNYYLLYNSTISCSLMFSGTCNLSGMFTYVPSLVSLFHVIHSYTSLEAERAFWITSNVLDFSRTATLSPAFNWYEGMFTTSPFTVMCLCDTNCLAPRLLGAIPIR